MRFPLSTIIGVLAVIAVGVYFHPKLHQMTMTASGFIEVAMIGGAVFAAGYFIGGWLTGWK